MWKICRQISGDGGLPDHVIQREKAYLLCCKLDAVNTARLPSRPREVLSPRTVNNPAPWQNQNNR